MTDYPPSVPEAETERMLDAHLHLLDRQVIDVAGVPITAVGDLELSDVPFDEEIPSGTPSPEVIALLSGPVLRTRIFGGRPPSSRLQRIPWSAVFKIDSVIRLAVRGDSLDITWPERWVRDHIIGRIPGGRHDPQ